MPVFHGFETLRVATTHETRWIAGRGVLDRLGDAWPGDARRAFVIGDADVLERFGNDLIRRLADLGVGATGLPFSPGEASKSRRTWGRLTDRLDLLGADRRSVVVGLGGGVSTDIAGFVAATAVRGLRGVLLPTSLVAMVDATIGGKTGLNTRAGKNRVGAMWWPLVVLADTACLATLPPDEMRCGLAETVKAAFVGDAGLLDLLAGQAAGLARGDPPSDEAIRRAVAVKWGIVARDPLEGGERHVLNFGHTVGHAIEAASGYRIPHGAAVAVGMRIEADIAARVVGLSPGDVRRLSDLLDALGLPRDPGCRFAEAAAFLGRDKKARDGGVRFSLPLAPGRMHPGDGDWTVAVDPATVEACWHGGD